MRVYLKPNASAISDNNGIGRIIHAQYKYLPELGVKFVDDPHSADVVACHAANGSELPHISVQHIHGAYWSGESGGDYNTWHHKANQEIASNARRAKIITVTSDWVAEFIRRDMRIEPTIIGHGIDFADWNVTEAKNSNLRYVLWNKNRNSDVCDPTPAYELANRGIQVVSTFAPQGKEATHNFKVVDSLPFASMKKLIENASIYLATTKETFGIGTVEAMAAGVPVLGYRWGGTADLVKHKETGYLVTPHDIDDLQEGYEWLKKHWAEVSANAREAARVYDWSNVMGRYVDVYKQSMSIPEEKTVAVVITNYNYGRYVGAAIESALAQTQPPDEIIVVDDGSTDESMDVINRYQDKGVRIIQQKNQGVAAARNNGIRASHSDFITCLDADDILDRRYISALQPAMQADRGLGIAYGSLVLFDDNNNQRYSKWGDFDWDFQSTPRNPPTTCIPTGSMFRRRMWERAGGYIQAHAPAEDAEFWTRGLSVGFNAKAVTQEAILWYRMHGGGASVTRPYKRIDDWMPFMRDKQYPFAAPVVTPTGSTPKTHVRSYSDPLVSVIIPVGPNHGQYLRGAIDSLLGQNAREWEAIVVDDTGTDELAEVLKPFPFVKYHKTEGRTGAGHARNIGLEHARAPLCLFLDADDYLMPQAIYRMSKVFAESGGRYVYTDWLALHAKDDIRAYETPEYDPVAWLTKGQHSVTVLMATEDARRIGGFDESMKGWEDWDFFIKCAITGIHGVRLPEVLFGYRLQTGTRREISMGAKEELLAEILARYGEYIRREKDMGSCCGGGGATNAAKTIYGLTPPEVLERALGVNEMGQTSIEPQTVRLRFDGNNEGEIVYKTRNGAGKYRVAKGQFLDVPKEDVDELLMKGPFVRITFHNPQSTLPAQRPESLVPTVATPTFEPPIQVKFDAENESSLLGNNGTVSQKPTQQSMADLGKQVQVSAESVNDDAVIMFALDGEGLDGDLYVPPIETLIDPTVSQEQEPKKRGRPKRVA